MQDKVFTLPKRLGFTVESSPLACWEGGVPTPFTPKASQMPVVTPFASRAVRGSRGYLGLGLGSWLDGNLSAGYRFVQSPKTTAGAYLQFNTTSLHRPRISVQAADVRRRLADGRLGLYASHIFDGKAPSMPPPTTGSPDGTITDTPPCPAFGPTASSPRGGCLQRRRRRRSTRRMRE